MRTSTSKQSFPTRKQTEHGTIKIEVFSNDGHFEQLLDVFPLFVIGRSPEADLRIEGDRWMSRFHCSLSCRGGKLYLRDLESENGTYINGKRVHGSQVVHQEDQIAAGTTRIVIRQFRQPG